MTEVLEHRLLDLEWQLMRDLDRLHDELLARLQSMARSVGQRTRSDRL